LLEIECAGFMSLVSNIIAFSVELAIERVAHRIAPSSWIWFLPGAKGVEVKLLERRDTAAKKMIV
jgi:hypothetical protein